ncbi:MAG: cupredoxin domain-containing protein [Candidatus Micrarchaeota archaeon]
MNKVLQIIAIIVVLLIVAAIPFVLFNGFSFSSQPAGNVVAVSGEIIPIVNGVQVVNLRANPAGYNLRSFTVKKGVPVKIIFSADNNAGCGRQLIMPDFNVNLIANGAEQVTAEFTPNQVGSFPYRCSMNMYKGVMTVVA